MLRNKILTQNKQTTTFEVIHKGRKYESVIDTKVFNELPNCYAWIVSPKKDKLYLQIWVSGKLEYLHRYILDYPTVCHHKTHTLDNRFSEIVACDYSTNNHFRRKIGNSKLPIGVIHTNSGRYKARIMKNGIQYNLGCYDTPEKAGEQYLKASNNLYN